MSNHLKPKLTDLDQVKALRCRNAPYWMILEYCRHLGIEKRPNKSAYWLARIRKLDGGYKQKRIGELITSNKTGLTPKQAISAANKWFETPEVQLIASKPYQLGSKQYLEYVKYGERFTIGDALVDFVEWKRISAASTTFETLISLINFHILPRIGLIPLSEFNGSHVTRFSKDILETTPKRGKLKGTNRVSLNGLTDEELRKRKKTLNTLLTIIRTSICHAWENGKTDNERAWLCVRRIPNRDAPRQRFLTREECILLINHCRLDLAKLVRAALYSGCRVSELTNIRVEDVGRDIFGIYIRASKNRKARYVFLPQEGMRFFYALTLDRDLPGDRLLQTHNNKAWSGRHKHLFRQAVMKAGLPKDFVFHGLRHTYASQLVQAGAPLTIVAKQLGHTNTDSVSRTYGHLNCECIEQELENRFANFEHRSDVHDHILLDFRNSLQNRVQAPSENGWPMKNFSSASGEIVSLVRR